ncbi:MAG: ThuA domain-containing protein [Bacteroidetes bacterium]|nr:ThuA domain-containing protein [Bacteroidota bacterium]
MFKTIQNVLIGLIAFLVLIGYHTGDAEGQHRYEVLVFSKTEGFRHTSIEAGIEAIQTLGEENNFGVFATENAAYFHSDSLQRFQAVVFLNTTEDVLNESQEQAFMNYIQSGGGWVGVHAAADTEYDWEWYGGLVGAYVSTHSDAQPADIIVSDRLHPSTSSLPIQWNQTDEWLNFSVNPRSNVHVLAVVKESTYEGGTMGDDHPIAWAHHYDGGRSWYTGLGHSVESYVDPLMRSHLLGGIEWAAGAVEADVTATLASAYDEVILTTDLTDPMEIDITSDGRVFILEWAGTIKLWEPDTGTSRVVGWLPVDKKIEDGLHGIALDPNFDDNSWIYIYYSAMTENSVNRLSRFVYDGHMLDTESEIVLLEVPVQRVKCCHSGGSIQFDKDGLLYVATGDNTGGDRNAPDPDLRRMSDQGRTSANTNDLRGKILRIKPQPDGTYSIPEGNLFEADSLHRGEIYSMGHRNPFRLAIDDSTGWIYWGDIGPGLINSWDEFNQAKEPGFYGWPYFTGYNDPYPHYHLAEQEYVEPDPMAPVNHSEYNTGAKQLPPALGAWIQYYYGPSEEYPELGAGGINPMAGPAFRIDPDNDLPTALPPYYDGKVMIYEWMRNWVQVIVINEDGSILDIEPFLPGKDYFSPMDIEVGPDGRLYIVEWGEMFWGSNANAQLVRLDYYGSSAPPPDPIPAEMPSSVLPLSIDWPPDGALFDFDSTYSYRVHVHDQAVSNETSIHVYTGIDTSPIPLSTSSGTEGEFLITREFSHPLEVNYVDRFALIKACLDTSCDKVKLHPRHKEAEHVSRAVNSIRTTFSTHPASKHWRVSALSSMPLKNESQLIYNPLNLTGIDSLLLRFRTTGNGILHFGTEDSDSTIAHLEITPETGVSVTPRQAEALSEVPEDFPGMETLAEGAYDRWREVSVPIPAIKKTIALMLTFTSPEEDTVMELDWIRFEGPALNN